MSNDQNEDDWESAEKRLKDLSIKNKSSKPPKLLLRPPMCVSQSTSGSNTQPHSRTRTPTPASTDPSAELDSAILSAISDPRERMAVFQMENNILNFMNSNETTMEIPPGNNSFRRLLTYRVGQRFGLSHATSDQLTESGGDRGGNVSIQLFKTPASAVPSVLLIDMKIATSQGESGGEQTAGSESPFDSSQHSSSKNNSSSGAGPRKMLVMKRKPSKTASGDAASARSAGSSAKQQQSAEDKEKAYLQARARIFGETESSTPEGSCNSPVNTPGQSGATTPKSDVAVRSTNGSVTTLSSPDHSNCSSGKVSRNSSSNSLSTAGIAVQKQQSAGSKKAAKNPATKAKAASPPHTEKAPSPKSRNSNVDGNVGRPQQTQHAGGRAVVNAGAWKGNKSQVRNVELEKADPDFVRQGPNSRQQGGAGTSQGGSQFKQQQQQQGSLPQQQQRPAPVGMPEQQPASPAADTDPSAVMQLQQQQQMEMMQMQQYAQMQQQQQQQYHQHHMHMQMYQQQQGVPYYPYAPTPQQQQMPPYPGNPYYPYGGAAVPYPQQLQQAQQQESYPGQQRGNSSAPAEAFNRNDFPPLR